MYNPPLCLNRYKKQSGGSDMNTTKIRHNLFTKQTASFLTGEGIEELKDTTVLVVGSGKGGYVASLQLAISNIGRLVLCDLNYSDSSNSNNEHLYTPASSNNTCSTKILNDLNPYVEVENINDLNAAILNKILFKYKNLSIFVDDEQNEVHFMINDFCIQNHIPAVHILKLGYKKVVYIYDSHNRTESIQQVIKRDVIKREKNIKSQSLKYFSGITSIVYSAAIIEVIRICITVARRNTINSLFYNNLEYESILTSRSKRELIPLNEIGVLNNAATRISSQFIDLLERQFPISIPNHPLELKTPQNYANILAIHVNHLNRSVKKVIGKTTSELIISRVIREAFILLQYTDWSISDISFGLGFEYPSYFGNLFKRHTGLTPSSIRDKAVDYAEEHSIV